MSGTLTINRVRADCRVAGTRAAALDVRDSAERALRSHLARELRDKLSGWIDRDDDSVWIVRRLDLAMLAGPDSPPDALAGYLAASLGRALSEVLRDDGDGVNAVRFRSREAYLAQFVVDVARGDPWGRWFYAPFKGLKFLSRSAAIRTALVEDPCRGIAALDSLDDSQLAAVAESLSVDDEAAVIDQFARLSSRADGMTEEVFKIAWAGCLRAMHTGIERGMQLFAFLRVSGRERGESVAQAIGVLVEASRRFVDHGRQDTERVARTLAIPTVVRHAMLARLRPDGTQASSSEPRRFTRHGGLCLLIRDLDTRPWGLWTAGWPSAPSNSPGQLLRWLTACMCGGKARVRAIFDDPGCRELFGIGRELHGLDVRHWLRDVGRYHRLALAKAVGHIGPHSSWRRIVRTIADAVLKDFARRLPGFAESTAEHLWHNFLDVGASFKCDGSQTIVQCDRPPLHLVLALTGMTRGMDAGRDGEGRPILIFTSDAP